VRITLGGVRKSSIANWVRFAPSACTFRKGDRVQDSFAALAIARYDGASDCYLFLCNEEWATQNDTDHRTIDEARELAESLYPGISNRWWAPAG
jgi:hypothetical protein